VFDFGLEVFVDRDTASAVRFKAGGGKIEILDGALAADGVEESVA
jgi:hypothetical protein